jgi:hypothetical protein
VANGQFNEIRGKTMTRIKNIGRFCASDKNGYILNDSSLKKVKPEFLMVIEEVVENYQTHLGLDLHSIYIRGSVPRGLGMKGVSDLDTIAITNKKTNNIDLKWVDKAEQELNNKFSAVNGVEFSFYHIEDILGTTTFSIIPFMIKTHSVCVYGEDLTLQIPDFRADKTVGNEHLINLKYQIEQAKNALVDNDDNEDIIDCCVWIMKILVRAGLALVIVEENLYTRDLYPAYKLFAKHFPEKEPEMKQALQYAIEPPKNPEDILVILNKFGNWMIYEAEKWIQTYNPNKVKNLEIS